MSLVVLDVIQDSGKEQKGTELNTLQLLLLAKNWVSCRMA
jgi:hypothetical protein